MKTSQSNFIVVLLLVGMLVILSCSRIENYPTTVNDYPSAIKGTPAEDNNVLHESSSLDWIQNPANHHYYRLTDQLPLLESEDQALDWGGHLVTLNNWEEELWIKSIFGEEVHLWIGLNDINEEGTMVWFSGDPVTYTNWEGGEPNNFCGYSPLCEDGVIMNWAPGLVKYGDKWNDIAIDHGYMGVVEKTVLLASIVIKPENYPNSINLKSNGVIPVAVLTNYDFDVNNIDPATVTFADAYPLRWSMEDVDDDGDTDMIFHFKTKELDLDENSTEATLTGETKTGQLFEGTDSVNIVP